MKKSAFVAALVFIYSLSHAAIFNVTNNAGGWQSNQPGPFTAGTFWEAIRATNAAGGGSHTINISVDMAAGGTNPAAFNLTNITADSIIIDGSTAPGGSATVVCPGFGAWTINAGVKKIVFKNVDFVGGWANAGFTIAGTGNHQIINCTLETMGITFDAGNNRIINSIFNGNSSVGLVFNNNGNNIVSGSTFATHQLTFTGVNSTGNYVINSRLTGSILSFTNGNNNFVRSTKFNTNAAGTATVASAANQAILVTGSTNLTIGGSAAFRNQFGGVGTNYINASGICDNLNISNNYFGVETSGATTLGLVSGSGILLSGNSSNVNINQNVINGAAASKGAIELAATFSSLNINDNFIGVNASGTFANGTAPNKGNNGSGIFASSGGINTGNINNNIISANGTKGIHIIPNTSSLTITNNKIGTSGSGLIAGNYGNLDDGIYLKGNSSSIKINDNLISNNEGHGIYFEGSITSSEVKNNIVGLAGNNIFAGVDFGNGLSGIIAHGGSVTTVSGLIMDNNTVCKNGRKDRSSTFQKEVCGIIFNSVAANSIGSVTISNNFVGIDRSNNRAGNTFAGVYFFSCGTMGGGSATNVIVSNNVIGDNGYTSGAGTLNSHGIAVFQSSNYTISNNSIGIGTNGADIGNGANGIELNTNANNGIVRDNNIQFNEGERTTAQSEACGGIVTFSSSNIIITGNIISNHTNAAGFVSNNGIVVQQGGGVRIGGTGVGEQNNISNNGTHGVFVMDGADNVEIRRNVINCNQSMGISLNISGDPNTVASKGAGNSSYAAPGPTFTTSGCPGGAAAGSGNANGTAPANSLIEIFESPSCRTCPSARRGEAQFYNQQVTADGAGNWTATGVTGNVSVTATSSTTTTVGGNSFRKTSRFSDCSTCSLPVEFTFLTVTKVEQVSIIKWGTSFETDASHFIVERSTDGKNFESLSGFIKAKNTSHVSNYEYADQFALNNLSYYRIKQVDLDGAVSYSKIVMLVNDRGLSLQVSPNPAEDKVQIAFSGENNSSYKIEFINLLGVSVHSQNLEVNDSQNLFEIQLPESLNGAYILQISNENSLIVQKIIIK